MGPRVCVFAGPSLPVQDRIVKDGLVYLPPASRGDVDRASREYDAMFLIDGVFHQDLAPSPKEVLAACRRTAVFGAASLGALRAAECWPFGMTPLGIVARWYICEIIDGDDEVAVLMHPQNHIALSIPSVSVRYVAWLARKRCILTRTQEAWWTHAARTQIFYADRTWDSALALAPRASQAALRELAMAHGDVKRLDAKFAMRRAARELGHRALAAA